MNDNNLPNQVSEFFENTKGSNFLWQYIQSLDAETASRLSKPTMEAVQVMERNIIGLLGGLPPEHFGVTVTTSREQLGRLLASAMVSGYFLHNAEQRMGFEKHLMGAATEESDSDEA